MDWSESRLTQRINFFHRAEECLIDARFMKKGRRLMAKITFRRSGGFIGHGMRYELNLNDMPISAVRNITRLVEEAQFSICPRT
jgi:hypothetical protein